MSEWKTRRLTNEVGYGYIVVREDGYIVVRDDGRVMATCKYRETCEQITLEHNSHAALLEACKGLVADDTIAAFGTLDMGPGGTREEGAAYALIWDRRDAANEAIKAAEATP